MKFGEECTRFFHANAIIKHKRNSISSLFDSTEVSLNTHEDKVSLLWEYFKERLGKSGYNHTHLDLDNLVSPTQDLEWLHEPFARREIDSTVTNLPTHKSPGMMVSTLTS